MSEHQQTQDESTASLSTTLQGLSLEGAGGMTSNAKSSDSEENQAEKKRAIIKHQAKVVSDINLTNASAIADLITELKEKFYDVAVLAPSFPRKEGEEPEKDDWELAWGSHGGGEDSKEESPKEGEGSGSYSFHTLRSTGLSNSPCHTLIERTENGDVQHKVHFAYYAAMEVLPEDLKSIVEEGQEGGKGSASTRTKLPKKVSLRTGSNETWVALLDRGLRKLFEDAESQGAGGEEKARERLLTVWGKRTEDGGSIKWRTLAFSMGQDSDDHKWTNLTVQWKAHPDCTTEETKLEGRGMLKQLQIHAHSVSPLPVLVRASSATTENQSNDTEEVGE